MKYFYIATMGCQMNDYDSDHLSQLIANYGYAQVADPDKADLIFINTCTVREKAQQKAFSLLGRMIKLKKNNPDIKLGLMGCVAQQYGARLIKRFKDLDIVLGTREVSGIHQILDRVIFQNEKVVATDISRLPSYESCGNLLQKEVVKANVSIMEGCNNFCSYCIVPYVRGRETSRTPGEIIKEVESLIAQGVKEITLLGQNVNSYYSKEGKGTEFPGLLRIVGEIEGLKRIRFTTSHPKDVSNELFAAFVKIENLCPHIHLPFQAGSDRILKLMNRGYSRDSYISLAKRFREIRTDFAITTDVMVGFPGETNDDFKKTLDLIEKIEFDNIFSFKYSDRKGTRASQMEGKIDEDEKSNRLLILQEMQKRITLARNRVLEGKIEQILIEGISKRKNQMSGRTGSNKIVNFTSDNNKLGELVNVRIKRGYINSLQGEKFCLTTCK